MCLVTGNQLLTPAIRDSGVNGVTRKRLIEWAGKKGIDCQEMPELRLEQVFSADALMVCNSVIGIWPVKQLENVFYSVNNELMQQLINEFPVICD